ncbi:MAG: helix-turn-helix domain-containing protein [Deltaproteobacteria bacterium]
MSTGKQIQSIRLQSKQTQQELAQASGLAVSYLSRIENDRIAPTVRTLGKIATALRVPMTSFFAAEEVLEASDHCPVSISGKCILDQVFAGRGQDPAPDVESYSPQQLQALRLCNFLLHTRDKELLRTLITMLKSLLAFSEARKAAGRK